jgi:hypothetical protein
MNGLSWFLASSEAFNGAGWCPASQQAGDQRTVATVALHENVARLSLQTRQRFRLPA